MDRLPPRGKTPTKGVSTFLIASILCLQMAPSASASVPRRDSGSRLLPRLNAEHVVLADCKGLNSDFSSQMAYFPGSPSGRPQDVAVVPTPDGQYSLWVDTTTSGLFTTTGVTFTADLGPRVADGEYAGSGDNGYGPFSCWAKYKKDIYTWGNTTCSMVYDCDHQDAPNASNESTTSASASASASASMTNTPLAGSSSAELSIGGIIGVSIGAGVGAILLAVGIFFLWRHLRNKNKPAELAAEAGFTKKGSKAPKPGHAPPPVVAGWYHLPPPPQELDSQWRGAEVHSDSRKDELDGNPRSELPLPTPGGEQLHSPGSPSSPGFRSSGTTQYSS